MVVELHWELAGMVWQWQPHILNLLEEENRVRKNKSNNNKNTTW
jgi:hypothetical protein